MGEGESPVLAYLGVGSNIQPEQNVAEALRLVTERVRVTGVSTFYRTTPLRGRRQPSYLNGVWRVETVAGPRTLKFDVLREVERRLGRVRSADSYASRTIDIDILLYGRVVIAESDLTIPDPEITRRAFLAVPLLELDPNIIIPGTGRSLASFVTDADRAGLEADRAFTERLRESVIP